MFAIRANNLRKSCRASGKLPKGTEEMLKDQNVKSILFFISSDRLGSRTHFKGPADADPQMNAFINGGVKAPNHLPASFEDSSKQTWTAT